VTNSKGWLALTAAVLAVGVGWTLLDWRPPAVVAAPLAQATDTPTPTATATATPTATATLPPFRTYSDGWGVQSLPEAGVNCVINRTLVSSGEFSCVAGTPVP
jgi:hypothetical protein